ncbi:M15 family metallopeptidase [Clostridium merdae]|uniref:M15 family metallopeptidase n=1 Tax=Clostridium merdae TaxID=1958780 RepID=UPI000A26B4CF
MIRKVIKRIQFLFYACLVIAIAALLYCLVTENNPLIKEHISQQQTSRASYNTSSTSSGNDNSAWYLILVNKWNPIPKEYKVDLVELENGESVDNRIYPSLQEMFDDARREDIYPVVASGYRTKKVQESIMKEKIQEYKKQGLSNKEAKTKAEAWVALPDTSEHQLGLSVDINADGIHSKGEEVYRWLDQNSYKYGFIRRYPQNKTDITGVIHEPWHYRYVGVDAAEAMHEQGICLEEYLNKTP